MPRKNQNAGDRPAGSKMNYESVAYFPPPLGRPKFTRAPGGNR